MSMLCVSLNTQYEYINIIYQFLFRYQTNTSAEVLDTITNIQPKESGGGAGETRESIVYRLAEDMLEKLPPNYVPHEVSAYSVYEG